MTKRSRTILFLVFLFLFILTAPAIVFYSQGYRLDFEKRKVTQTGAFYFKTVPKSSWVYIDGQPKKKTDFLFGSILIGNLLPKKYTIAIKKEGYFSWQKTLEVKESQVTEAKNVVLIPENLQFSIVDEEVKGFYFSPDGGKIVLEKTDKNGCYLELYDLKANDRGCLMKQGKALLNGLIFSPDSLNILINVEDGEASKYFLLDLYAGPLPEKTIQSPLKEYALQPLLALDFLAPDLADIFFNPENPKKFFFSAKKIIFEMDLIKKAVSPPLLENVFSYRVFDKNIYYLDGSGFLFKTDLSFNQKENINTNIFPAKPGSKYGLEIFPGFMSIMEEETLSLYKFNPDSKDFEKFLNAKELKISPDKRKLVLASPGEIWILFLREIFDQPQKKAGEMVFLTRFSEKIENIFWLTSHYLIFSSANKIKIAEIDERDRINIVDPTFKLSDGNPVNLANPTIFLNDGDKKLYLLNNNTLYFSETLIK